jgi:tetratricopeptide (TPR) repeat protein
LEKCLFADAADGRWDEHSLLGAALVASGVNDRELLLDYETQVAHLAAELEQSGKMAGPPRQQAQTLFEFMHGRILQGGYQLDSTSVALALDKGRFNCVSASVLFNCLAARFGLSASGLEIPGHAMSRLVFPDGQLDVETTCPGWFRLMDDPQKQAELVEKTIGMRPGEGNAPVAPREVSDVELVATIYYNRGVDLLAEKRFAEAVAANARALRLDPSSTTARGNLLATINNWAIDVDGAGRHAEAVELLRKGIALDPEYETFRVNYVHVHSRWIEELCRGERFQEALDLIARAMEDRVEEAHFAKARLDVSRRWARSSPEATATGRADGASLRFSGN